LLDYVKPWDGPRIEEAITESKIKGLVTVYDAKIATSYIIKTSEKIQLDQLADKVQPSTQLCEESMQS